MMISPTNHAATATATSPGPTETIVSRGSFLICAPDGWINPGSMQGYYAGDTRVLSVLTAHFNGQPMHTIRTTSDGDVIEAIGVIGDIVRPDLMIVSWVSIEDAALTIRLELTNLRTDDFDVTVEVTCAADFADIFDVRRSVRPRSGFVGAGPSDGDLMLAYENGAFRRALRIKCDLPCDVLRDGLSASFTLEPRSSVVMKLRCIPEAARHQPLLVIAPASTSKTVFDVAEPVPDGLDAIHAVWQRSLEDLNALLIADPLDPSRITVAAGSPWFMTLFGRDSLIASWESMILGTKLAMNTLDALAARQGTQEIESTDEQPGKILHEVRTGEAVQRSTGWGALYYGTVDATPLFIMTLAEAWRWGADIEHVRRLLPAAERAAAWMQRYGDLDGDGFIEYPAARVRDHTLLVNLAWKDSDDAIRHDDGTVATGPIAMVEVQAYQHAALLALAELREALGPADADSLREQARTLQNRIDEAFWVEDEQCYAMALDGDKKQVRSVSTNAGHLLWTGTAFAHRAEALAERLLQPDMFTGFGLRTLSANNPAFNPLSYHCGSVWPHDTAIVAAGLYRYGQSAAGHRVAEALLSAADDNSGRLPELFGGFSREEQERPVPYTSSCSPQAWAAGAPLLLARAMRGMHPPRG